MTGKQYFKSKRNNTYSPHLNWKTFSRLCKAASPSRTWKMNPSRNHHHPNPRGLPPACPSSSARRGSATTAPVPMPSGRSHSLDGLLDSVPSADGTPSTKLSQSCRDDLDTSCCDKNGNALVPQKAARQDSSSLMSLHSDSSDNSCSSKQKTSSNKSRFVNRCVDKFRALIRK